MTGAEIVADGSGHVVRLDGRDQSHVDLNDPGRLVFGYVRCLGDVLDARAAPGAPIRVVHVGGAGLSLPRYVASTRPGSAQVVLEPDETLTALVRRDLPLPARSGIKVRAVDGRAGVAGLRPGWDVVVVDAFAGGRVPASLVSRTWFEAVAAVLAPQGWLLLNLTDRPPYAHTRRVLAGLRLHLPQVLLCAEPSTLKGRRTGNLVVVAGRGPLPLAALRERSRTAALPVRVLDDRAVRDGFGGGLPFEDHDAVDGPAGE